MNKGEREQFFQQLFVTVDPNTEHGQAIHAVVDNAVNETKNHCFEDIIRLYNGFKTAFESSDGDFVSLANEVAQVLNQYAINRLQY